jgi:N-acetylglucosaminyldiphosphoundecaprenol N-acetyl-beta-D-mannosaminyltransferase
VALPDRVSLMGVRFDVMNERQLIDHLLAELDAGRGGWVVTPNVDILRQTTQQPELAELVSLATLVVADGAPVEWAGRLSGQGMPPRIAGASLLWSLSAGAAACGRKVFLLGGRRGAGSKAMVALQQAYSGLQVDVHCPPFGFETDTAASAAVRTALRAAGSDIVFCAFGFPKQERLMARLSPEFPHTWFLGVGASIDFAAGYVPRAPLWMQRAGIEWMFRLATEPKRLARRYLRDDIPFAARLMAWAAAERARSLLKLRQGKTARTVTRNGEVRSTISQTGTEQHDRS